MPHGNPYFTRSHRHPSGRPQRRIERTSRGYWNTPQTEAATPRLRTAGKLADRIGFVADLRTEPDDE
jgi:hypothetical protein